MDVSGTFTDDGAIRALAGKPALSELRSGNLVTDDGLALLRELPIFRTWHGGESWMAFTSASDDGFIALSRSRSIEHIWGRRSTLKKYFVSYNRITDRTPVILSGLTTLEELTFDSCAGLTNEGIMALARLPNLRHVSVGGMPRVTNAIVPAFPAHVRVTYQV